MIYPRHSVFHTYDVNEPGGQTIICFDKGSTNVG